MSCDSQVVDDRYIAPGIHSGSDWGSTGRLLSGSLGKDQHSTSVSHKICEIIYIFIYLDSW